jgi:hypothetical protein
MTDGLHGCGSAVAACGDQLVTGVSFTANGSRCNAVYLGLGFYGS